MQQLTSNITFNLFALGFAGGCGILFNLLISFLYGTQALGLISQVYSLLIIFGQLGVFGNQFSVQTFVASTESHEEKSKIIVNALGLSVVISAVVSLIFFFLAGAISEMQTNPALYDSIRMASLGLFFFCLNKVVLGALNGLIQMRSFAVLQLIRALLLLIVSYTLYLVGISVDKISMIFTISESIVFVIGITILFRQKLLLLKYFNRQWLKSHFHFGMQSMPAGLLIEMNTKVDVLMLGYFLSDREVGIFSMAATFSEGFSLILNVLRSNFNPIMAKYVVSKNYDELRNFIVGYKVKIIKGILALALVSLIVYKVIGLFSGNEDWNQSFINYCLLLVGVVAISKSFPFLTLIVQAGKPGWFSIAILIGILVNCVFNLILIPWLGTKGAAISTSLSGIINAMVTIAITNKVLKRKLL